MGFKNIFQLCFFSFVINNVSLAQDAPVKEDSTRIYKNIESYSGRRKFTKFLYQLIFKPVVTGSQADQPKKKTYKKLIQKPYSAFEGKIIRHINIETLDPFGYSVTDTSASAQNFLFRAGNSLHIKSQHVTIRNLLLIRQNQQFDSLLVKESERLVRTSKYVHDVHFSVALTSKNSDSVDVSIRESDNWSIIPKIAISTSQFKIDLTDRNFLGFGHEYQNAFTWFQTTGTTAYTTNYFIPNIRNTYVNTTLHYSTDEYGNFIRSFAVDRPFFSPFAKWAAGINLAHQFRRDSIYTNDSTHVLQSYKSNSQDYWAGKSIQMFKGNTENIRTTNFIAAVRFLRVRYSEKPMESYDTLHLYADEYFYLSSIGISTRKYVQDRYIFRYGVTEDVPIGRVFALTGGYQIKNRSGRLYLGARISSGNYYPWGYLSSSFEYGTFFNGSHAEQGTLGAGIIYFSGMAEIGTWKFRQFIKPQVTIGINRFPYDSLTLKEGNGLDGFNSTALFGTSRLMFTGQTQFYAPWDLIGFRFGPYLSYSFGMLAGDLSGFKKSRIYSQIGFGVLIKNENLVFSTFQLSVSFYPLIPGVGQDVYKLNSFKTTDFSFRDFEIGKPAAIAFQ